MRNKDQECLTFLYENLVEANMIPIIDEENEYFSFMAKDITQKVYKEIKSFRNDLPHNKSIKQIGKIHSGQSGEAILLKLIPKEVLEACRLVYYNYIIHDVINSLVFATHEYEPEETQYFAFKKPDAYINQTLRRVDYKDKEKFEKSLKDWFILTLDFIRQYYNDDPPVKKWSQWRNERIKFQNVVKTLPELKGIF